MAAGQLNVILAKALINRAFRHNQTGLEDKDFPNIAVGLRLGFQQMKLLTSWG